MLASISVPAQQKPARPGDLTNLSLDELMDVEITSVSKKEERLFQSAAAAYVIGQEEIRRSGMSSVPDLLRLVPGLEVAQIDGSKWAVSARGFNGRVANKLLVLIDGRSVYSQETSGVYWEVQDLLLEDIERIEVIRGPGGTLWGANAVNGVINIITKASHETQGALITMGTGTRERGFGSLRYGSKLGDKGYYRVYGKYFTQDGLSDANGEDARDGQQALRGGGRLDLQLTRRDSLMLEGDFYGSKIRENPNAITLAAPFTPPGNLPGSYSGGNLLGRWTREFSKQSSMELQLYYDRFNRDIFEIGGRIDTFDVGLQHRLAIGKRQDVVWGLGSRVTRHESISSSAHPAQFNPPVESNVQLNIFAQDEITLLRDGLKLTIGTKVERFTELGEPSTFHAEPSVRVSWTPERRQTIWAAVSHAVKTPARSDTDIRGAVAAFPGPGGTPNIIAFFGNQNFRSETVLAYEVGYRAQPHARLLLDVAGFYNFYDHLQSFEPGAPFFEGDPAPGHVIIPAIFSNLMRGTTYGVETSVNLNVNTRLRLAGSYSFLRISLNKYAESLDNTTSKVVEGSSPQHQFQLHSYFRLSGKFELDAALYAVSGLVYQGAPNYARLDLRLGWHPSENVEISAGGQNLLDGRHAEFGSGEAAVRASEVRRSAYAKVTFRF